MLDLTSKKILVTGGLGFIGSNFIICLQDRFNADIVNVDKLSYASNDPLSLNFEKRGKYKFIRADLADERFVDEIINNEKPRLLFIWQLSHTLTEVLKVQNRLFHPT